MHFVPKVLLLSDISTGSHLSPITGREGGREKERETLVAHRKLSREMRMT